MATRYTSDEELTTVANAIRTKGGTNGTLSWPTGFVSAIGNIEIGVDTSDASATAADIMPGKTAYVNGNKITGNSTAVVTSDANATASDIMPGKTAYVNGVKISGASTAIENAAGVFVDADYEGAGYCYIHLSNGFTANTNNSTIMSYFVVPAGTYIFHAKEHVGNRMRAQFFAGKTLSDFEQYIYNASSSATAIYAYTNTITGTSELSGANLSKWFIFQAAESGTIIVQTSSESDAETGTIMIKAL